MNEGHLLVDIQGDVEQRLVAIEQTALNSLMAAPPPGLESGLSSASHAVPACSCRVGSRALIAPSKPIRCIELPRFASQASRHQLSAPCTFPATTANADRRQGEQG